MDGFVVSVEPNEHPPEGGVNTLVFPTKENEGVEDSAKVNEFLTGFSPTDEFDVPGTTTVFALLSDCFATNDSAFEKMDVLF